ncbi:GNAT family N-acetyltransferase [Halorussus ruber]|uniref:GNAT family N-acetyltransferase n=1 Tax=Halorussus ruber TaxID=1126238 RepID=UPI001092433B|nr:GNAT family N-acetyltransferase [Halorussus ruber]
MTTDGVSVVRTGLNGHEPELRNLLVEYYEFADELAVEHFDALDGLDAAEAAQSDLDRLADAKIGDPLFLALEESRTGKEGQNSDESRNSDEDRIVGTVQLKRLDETTAEVKRLYVVPSRQGEGLGRRLMERVLDGARADGFETLLLGVGPYLEAARALYEDLGFEYIPPYDQSQAPPEIRDEWKFMEYSLDDS